MTGLDPRLDGPEPDDPSSGHAFFFATPGGRWRLARDGARSELEVPDPIASEIRLYFPNRGKIDTWQGHAAAFDWLNTASGGTVKTVNESHGFGGTQTNDWWARYGGVLAVRAAGNSADSPACPMTANSLCVGATRMDPQVGNQEMAPYSSYKNPQGTATPPDREEPDIVAFGGDESFGYDQVRMIGFSSTTDWSGENKGTSEAAAVVTAMVAHVRNACVSPNPIAPAAMRAIFRSAAWSQNPDGAFAVPGPTYSTPSNLGSRDYYDGAGWPSAFDIDWLCGGGEGNTWGTVWIDLSRGRDPQGGSSSTYCPGLPKGDPGCHQSLGMDTVAYDDPAQNPGRKEQDLGIWNYLNVGDRARFTVAWEACGDGVNGDVGTGDPPDVGIDLDVFLFNQTANRYVYGSQSIDDVNEGFDVIIGPQDGAGEYRILISWPAGLTTDCGAGGLALAWAGRWEALPW